MQDEHSSWFNVSKFIKMKANEITLGIFLSKNTFVPSKSINSHIFYIFMHQHNQSDIFHRFPGTSNRTFNFRYFKGKNALPEKQKVWFYLTNLLCITFSSCHGTLCSVVAVFVEKGTHCHIFRIHEKFKRFAEKKSTNNQIRMNKNI